MRPTIFRPSASYSRSLTVAATARPYNLLGLWRPRDRLDRNRFENHRLGRSSQTWRILGIGPQLGGQENLEPARLGGGVEVEVDHDVLRILHRTLDALRPDSSVAP